MLWLRWGWWAAVVAALPAFAQEACLSCHGPDGNSVTAGIPSIGDWIGQGFDDFPNVKRWLATVTARPSWKAVEQDHKNLAGYFSSGTYAKIEGAARTAS